MRARLPKKCTGVADSCGQGCRKGPQAGEISCGQGCRRSAQAGEISCGQGCLGSGCATCRELVPHAAGPYRIQNSVECAPARGFRCGKCEAPACVRRAGAKDICVVPCRVTRMGFRAPCAQAHGHRLMGTDSRAQARAHRLGEHMPRAHGIDLVPAKLPLDATKGPLPGGYPGFGSGSGAVPHGAPVTGEVTATRRFGVLQMSGLRSNVPLHLVATRV